MMRRSHAIHPLLVLAAFALQRAAASGCAQRELRETVEPDVIGFLQVSQPLVEAKSHSPLLNWAASPFGVQLSSAAVTEMLKAVNKSMELLSQKKSNLVVQTQRNNAEFFASMKQAEGALSSFSASGVNAVVPALRMENSTVEQAKHALNIIGETFALDEERVARLMDPLESAQAAMTRFSKHLSETKAAMDHATAIPEKATVDKLMEMNAVLTKAADELDIIPLYFQMPFDKLSKSVMKSLHSLYSAGVLDQGVETTANVTLTHMTKTAYDFGQVVPDAAHRFITQLQNVLVALHKDLEADIGTTGTTANETQKALEGFGTAVLFGGL